jgi:hypothetical protein
LKRFEHIQRRDVIATMPCPRLLLDRALRLRLSGFNVSPTSVGSIAGKNPCSD